MNFLEARSRHSFVCTFTYFAYAEWNICYFS